MTDTNGNGPGSPGKAAKAPPLPKRFYQAATVTAIVPSPLAGEGQGGGDGRTSPAGVPPTPNPSPQGGGGRVAQGGYRVLLDGKPIRTPAKRELVLPTQGLAEAIAAEWSAQGARIEPRTMPLTRLANSAIDGVWGREAEVRADIAKYAGGDLVCYRAEGPQELVRRQAEGWDPVLAWAREALRADLQVVTGVMPVTQPEAGRSAVAAALDKLDAFALAPLHVVTTLTGSALLALACVRGHLSAETAWALAHIDEDFQIGKWGWDAEAKALRERRWAEMAAASRMLVLLG